MLGSVQISGEDIGDVDTQDICDSLRTNSIRLLSVRGCKFEDHHFRKIMESIKECTSLAHLNLNLSVVNSKERVTWLAEGLKENLNLTTLLLHGNPIGDAGMTKIVSALTDHKKVKSLDVGDCHLGDDAISSLCSLLKANKSVVELTLTGNREVSDMGWSQMAMVIAHGCHLKQLYLDYNIIGDFGAGLFAVALSSSKHLEVLDLEGSRITDAGADLLCDALENYNSNMREINLAENSISEDIVAEIKECLQENIKAKSFHEER